MSKLTELLCPNGCDTVLTYARNKSVVFCFDDDEDITPTVHAVRCPVCGYLDVSTEPEYLIKLYSNENPVLDPEVTTQLVKALEAVEWGGNRLDGDDYNPTLTDCICPCCGSHELEGHEKTCKLAAALAAARGTNPC